MKRFFKALFGKPQTIRTHKAIPKTRLGLEALDGRILPSGNLTTYESRPGTVVASTWSFISTTTPGITLANNGVLVVVGDNTDNEHEIAGTTTEVNVTTRFWQTVTSSVNGSKDTKQIWTESIETFDKSAVTRIEYYGNDGNDKFLNRTAIPGTYRGQDGDDTLTGGSAADKLDGGIGIDDLYGKAGNDTLLGGSGGDGLTGGTGNDWLDGGTGSDLFSFAGSGLGYDNLYAAGYDADTLDFTGIAGGIIIDLTQTTIQNYLPGSVTVASYLTINTAGSVADVWGGNYADQIRGNQFANHLDGNGGRDTIAGSSGYDTLDGGTDNDIIYGEEGNDFIDGGDGNDKLYGLADNDTLVGGKNDDLLEGGTEADSLQGGDGHDTLTGWSGNDTLSGGIGIDSLSGGNDNDKLYGDGDNDTLLGDAGRDTLYGSTGNDAIWGGTENDLIFGEIGNDTLYGESGSDTLWGGTGNDRIEGGYENDTLYGESGNDSLYGDQGDDYLNSAAGGEVAEGGSGSDQIPYGWAVNGTIASDIKQAGSSTCVFLSSLASVANAGADFTHRIEFLGNSNYRVYLWNWETGAYESEVVYYDGTVYAWDAQTGSEGEFWTTLFQRAYVQMWDRLGESLIADGIGFDQKEALFALTGQDAVNVDPDSIAPSIIRDVILQHGAVIACSADAEGIIISGHAYSVIDVWLQDGEWMVKLRNPWGRDSWTDPLDGLNDGFITMTWTDFYDRYDFDNLYYTTSIG